jgi:hypothetical protein
MLNSGAFQSLLTVMHGVSDVSDADGFYQSGLIHANINRRNPFSATELACAEEREGTRFDPCCRTSDCGRHFQAVCDPRRIDLRVMASQIVCIMSFAEHVRPRSKEPIASRAASL